MLSPLSADSSVVATFSAGVCVVVSCVVGGVSPWEMVRDVEAYWSTSEYAGSSDSLGLAEGSCSRGV